MRLPFVAAPGWWVGARCRAERIPLERFFLRDEAPAAREICAGCIVRLRCLAEHLDEPYGVWGGHARDERSRIRAALEHGASLADASRIIDEKRAPRGPRTPRS